VTLAPAQQEIVRCPKCRRANPATAYFCIDCHAVLIRRCPNCWHEQREGNVCEKCGANFALFLEAALERSIEEDSRVQRDKFLAGLGAFAQILLLPFSSLGGLLRALIARLIAIRLSNR